MNFKNVVEINILNNFVYAYDRQFDLDLEKVFRKKTTRTFLENFNYKDIKTNRKVGI